MNKNSEEHDPFNEPRQRSKRSRELMKEDFFWDCVDEESPFGSDEGWEAYYSYRDWRKENPKGTPIEYMDDVMLGQSNDYNTSLTNDEVIIQSAKSPRKAFLGDKYDPSVLDVTVLAICLGQLIDEGKINTSLKKFGEIAVVRQRHKALRPSKHRLSILDACLRVLREG